MICFFLNCWNLRGCGVGWDVFEKLSGDLFLSKVRGNVQSSHSWWWVVLANQNEIRKYHQYFTVELFQNQNLNLTNFRARLFEADACFGKGVEDVCVPTLRRNVKKIRSLFQMKYLCSQVDRCETINILIRWTDLKSGRGFNFHVRLK